MKLLVSGTSPYVRKVRVVAIEKHLDSQLQLIEALPWPEPTAIVALNPLGKIPALVTDDGVTLYDSPVICEYLDALTPTIPLIPAAGPHRWRVLRLQALADGVLDAAVQLLLENRRSPEKQSTVWKDRQIAAIRRAIVALQDDTALDTTPLDLGQITTVIALEYLQFRFPDLDFGIADTRLAAWWRTLRERPSFVATRPAE